MTTLRDVARRAGVSPMTVSRVVNGSGRVSPDLRARVEQALAETGYLPNTVARNLRTRRTDTIALVMPDMTNPFFTALAHGVEMSAREVGISLLVANSDEREDEEQRLVQVLLQRQVDGILLIPAGAGGAAIGRCRAHDVPVVIVDRRPGTPGVDVVRADAEDGALQLGRLMVGLGHRRMAVLTGPASVPTAVDRAVGFQPRPRGGLRPPRTQRRVRRLHDRERARHDAGRDGTSAPRPTALFAANNFIAIGVLHALEELGLEVPDDVAVVGFDDLPRADGHLPLPHGRGPARVRAGPSERGRPPRPPGRPRSPAQEVVLPTEIVLRRSSGGRIGESVQG